MTVREIQRFLEEQYKAEVSETIGERDERLGAFFVHRLCHGLLGGGQRADARRACQVRMDVRDQCVRICTTR